MTETEKWEYVVALDEKYLVGSVVLSEWTSEIVRNVDTAYCAGANLAAILTAQAAIECHLRYEYSQFHHGKKLGFQQLIDQSPLDNRLRNDLHSLRRFRNRWVHVNDPHDDEELLAKPEVKDNELEEFAVKTVELLRRVLYLEQCI